MKIIFVSQWWSTNHFYWSDKALTLLNIYYFRSIFQVISLGLKQFLLLFIKTGFTIFLKIDLYIQGVSSLSYLLFNFSLVERREKTNSLEKQHKIICFMFHNNFSIRTLCKRAKHHCCFKKRSVGLQNLMFGKCYLQA